MGAENESVQVVFGANIAALNSGLADATGGVREAVSNMEGHFSGLGKALENLKAPFVAFTALLAGGAWGKESVGAFTGMVGETAKLARQLGITTEEASGLREALEKLGIGSDLYGAAVFKLQIALRTQEEELNRNGIVTRNAKGEHLAIQDVMMNGINRLKDMNKGYDANALSMLMWGRSAKEMQGLQRLTNERIAEGYAETKKLGTSISSEQVAASRAYKEAMVDVKDVFEAIQVQVGAGLLPKLTEMGVWFGEHGPALIGPVVTAFSALTQALSYTTVQIALVAAALWGPMVSAWGAASQAAMAFVQTLRVQMALGAMEGVTGIRAIIGGLQSMINPWLLAGAAIVAGGIALERWMSSASRAAEEHSKLVGEMRRSATEFERLQSAVLDYQKTLDDSKATDEEKKKAQEMLGITVQQLRALYPQYAAMLTDEQIKQKGILEVLKEINVQREKDLRAQIAQTEAMLGSLKAKEADLLVTAATARAWGVLGDVWAAISGKRADDVSKAMAKLTKDLDEQRAALRALIGESSTDQKKPGAAFKDKPKDGKEDDDLRRWKDNLTKKLEDQGAFFSDSIQMSLDYWAKILETEKLSPKQIQAINQEVWKLKKVQAREGEAAIHAESETALARAKNDSAQRVEIARAEAERLKGVWGERSKQYQEGLKKVEEEEENHRQKLRQLEVMSIESTRDHELAKLEIEEETLKQRLALGEIDATQELAALQKLEERRFEIKRNAAVREAFLEADPAKRQERLNQIQQIEDAYNLKRKQTQDQMVQEQVRGIQEFISPAVSSMNSVFSGWLKGTMSFRDGFRGILQGIGSMFDQALAKMASDWIANQAKMLLYSILYKGKEVGVHTAAEGMKTGATGTGVMARIALETAGAVKSVALAVWQGLKWIAIKGYEAAAGAYSAISSIPFVGPFLAPAVAAGVLASVIGLGAKVASASGGWKQVPHDQLAMIHKDEQVLPANYATGLRKLIDGGGSSGRQLVQEVHQHTWTVQTLDASSFEEFLMTKGQAAVVRVSREAARNGRM